MSWLYHKDGIVTGFLEYYCLICECLLMSEEDVKAHTASPTHRKNADATSYFQKFKEDRIKKVKRGYFCEFCNKLLATATKVNLHIAEAKHITKKGKKQLRRVGESIVASGDILIEEKAWQGLIDDTCATCNLEFQNEDIHKAEPTHMLNLVQSKIEFRANNVLYRMVDESSFQCLTCNEMLALKSVSTHFNEDEHKNLITTYTEPQPHILESNIDEKKVRVPDTAEPKHTTNEKPVAKIAKESNDNIKKKAPASTLKTKADPSSNHNGDQHVPTNKKEIKASAAEKSNNKHDTTATCTKTVVETKSVNAGKPVEVAKPKAVPTSEMSTQSTSKPKDTNVNTNKGDKRTETAKKSERPERGTMEFDEAICEALGATNYITDNDNGKKWCLICDWGMDMLVVESHIHSRHHQTMLKLHKQRLLKKSETPKSPDKIKTKPADFKDKFKEAASSEPDNCSKILDNVSKFQEEDVKINFLSESAFCKKCSKDINFNFEAIKKHCEEHKPPPKEVNKKAEKKESQKVPTVPVAAANDKAKENKKSVQLTNPVKTQRDSRTNSFSSTQEVDEETELFAKENELIYSAKDNRLYCYTCNTQVPYSLKNMKEHVSGTLHKSKIGKSGSGPDKTVKMPMKQFIETLVAVDNGFMKDFVINKKYCVNMLSFLMITKDAKLRCLPCRLTLDISEVDSHKATPCHEKAMSETPIISSLESEFVREIRPDFFHCGFCNSVETDREDLEKHFKTASHRESKNSANWRLQQYLPEMMQHRQNRSMEIRSLMNMLMHGNPF